MTDDLRPVACILAKAAHRLADEERAASESAAAPEPTTGSGDVASQASSGDEARLKSDLDAQFRRAFGPVKNEREQRTLDAFLAGAAQAHKTAAKKDAFRANARRSRFRKSDRPAQQSPKRKA